jgi:hypothetical protein
MRFEKIGKIFDPREYPLFTQLREYAQSPQAIVLEDRVRIFFSTREQDRAGMFISLPAFVDMDFDFKEVLGVSRMPIIALGERGCFDEHGIFPLSPVPFNNKLLAYTTGWTRRQAVATDSGIGLAISEDSGETFIKYGQGPIVGPSLHEPFLVSDAFVLHHEDKFHMWYIYGQRWIYGTEGAPPDRVYKIAHAESIDGVNWTRSGEPVISDWLGKDECQALPCVFRHGEGWHMVFCYRYATDFRRNPNRAYRLGYAYSTDFVSWIRSDLHLIDTSEALGWDAEMQCYPNVVKIKNQIYLLYNGNEFGRYGFGVARLV